jgi:PAS domain-containing protein
MKRTPTCSTEAAAVRHRAEARLQERSSGSSQARIESDTLRLVHELEVHQVELEMQKEELQKARDEATSALEKYSNLYDFAPVSYLTLNREGAIQEANLAAASLLATERAGLLKQRLGRYIAAADRPAFTAFLKRVFESKAREFCEVTLLKEGKPPVEVRIAGAVAALEQECRAVLEDITLQNRAEAVLRKSQREALVASRSGTTIGASQALEAGVQPLRRVGRSPNQR